MFQLSHIILNLILTTLSMIRLLNMDIYDILILKHAKVKRPLIKSITNLQKMTNRPVKVISRASSLVKVHTIFFR